MKNGYGKAILLALLMVAVVSLVHAAGAPAYLSAPRGGVGGFPVTGGVPVYGDIDAIQGGMTRGNPIAAMNENTLCNALDGTMVEVYEDTRTRVGALGDFMKVTILNGDCRGKEGWVQIGNIHKIVP